MCRWLMTTGKELPDRQMSKRCRNEGQNETLETGSCRGSARGTSAPRYEGMWPTVEWYEKEEVSEVSSEDSHVFRLTLSDAIPSKNTTTS